MSKVAVRIIIIVASVLVTCGILTPIIYFNWDFIQYTIFKKERLAEEEGVRPPFVPPVIEDEEQEDQTPEDQPQEPTNPDNPEVEQPTYPEEPIEPEPEEPTYPEDPELEPDEEPEVKPPYPEGVVEPGPEYSDDPVDPDPVIPDTPDPEPEEPDTDFEDNENIVDPIVPSVPDDEEESPEPTYPDLEDNEDILEPTEPEEEEQPPVTPDPEPDPDPEEPEIELTEDEIKFNDLVDRLAKLETMAKDYFQGTGDDHVLEMLRFIRSGKWNYNDSEWKIVAGEADEGFIAHVQANQGSDDLIGLRNPSSSIAFFNVPFTDDKIDFFHLIAVMNVEYMGNQGNADLSGWGGDLVQLMSNFKNSTLTGNELVASVKLAFNKLDNYGFGAADVCSDLDATNMVARFKRGGYSSLTECFAEYYKEVTDGIRKSEFKTAAFAGSCTESKVKSRMTSNLLIRYLASNNYGVSLSGEVFNACVKVFVEYINS